MDEIGMDVPVPQMQVRVSRESAKKDTSWEEMEEVTEPVPLSPVERSAAAKARDVSHEPQPAPPPTDQSVQVPPQIPTASEPGKA
jgi:small conductance mechanosensitive channel